MRLHTRERKWKVKKEIGEDPDAENYVSERRDSEWKCSFPKRVERTS